MDLAYADPRLAALYDALSPPGADTRFYVRLAGTRPLAVLDLGLGTGQLACALAAAGHEVVGVDPAPAMLAVARGRPGGGRVAWFEGDARSLELGRRFDLVLMTGHVFQIFLADEEVGAVLATARRHLAAGGRLAFETRNPFPRPREGWTPAASRRRVDVEGVGTVEVFHRLLRVDGPLVGFETCHCLPGGEVAVSRSTLRFIAREEVTRHLAEAGLGEVRWFGGWDGGHRNSFFHYTPLPQEDALDTALDLAEPRASAALKTEDFEGAMAALAGLRAPVDAFFDHVTVNDPDPEKRETRLILLARIRHAVHQVADFSKIEG